MEWRRGGRTAERWSEWGRDVRVGEPLDGSITFNFEIPAAGGGFTRVQLAIEPHEFDDLFAKMRPRQALKLFRQMEQELSKVRLENERLRSENERLRSQVFNESVRPDRVAEFRKKALKAVIKAVVET